MVGWCAMPSGVEHPATQAARAQHGLLPHAPPPPPTDNHHRPTTTTNDFSPPRTFQPPAGELRFRDLVGGKNIKAERRRQRTEAAARLALETVLFGAAWYAWQLWQQQQGAAPPPG